MFWITALLPGVKKKKRKEKKKEKKERKKGEGEKKWMNGYGPATHSLFVQLKIRRNAKQLQGSLCLDGTALYVCTAIISLRR